LASEFSWLLDMGGTPPFSYTPIFSQLQGEKGDSELQACPETFMDGLFGLPRLKAIADGDQLPNLSL